MPTESNASIVFGGAPLGNLFTAVSDLDATRAVEHALTLGLRRFDTAPHYGLGLSERRIGEVLRHYDRSTVEISTKVGRTLEPNPRPVGSDLAAGFDVPDSHVRRFDFSAGAVRDGLAASLDRLRTDFVDTVFVHDPAGHTAVVADQTIPALLELRCEGVVGRIGVATADLPTLLRLVELVPLDVVMVANRWTLLDRSAGPLLDRCHESGAGVVVAAPFNSGILASPDEVTARFDYRAAPPAVLDLVRDMAALCAAHGVPLAQAALQFGLRHPAVEGVAVGMRSSAEVRDNVELSRAATPAAVWAGLDRLMARQENPSAAEAVIG